MNEANRFGEYVARLHLAYKGSLKMTEESLADLLAFAYHQGFLGNEAPATDLDVPRIRGLATPAESPVKGETTHVVFGLGIKKTAKPANVKREYTLAGIGLPKGR
jgi:hypothetical protein